MLAQGKPIVFKKVKLYVQNMTNGDLEVKRLEPKSNQPAPTTVAMETAPAASKPTVVVKKISKAFKSH